MSVKQSHFPFVLCRIEPPPNTNVGDHDHRTNETGMAMAKEKGVFVITLTNDHRRKWNIAAQANVLVLKNIRDSDFLPLIKQRKDQGKITVYEIADDFDDFEPWTPDGETLIRRIAGYCDALQVTSARLKDLYGHLNPICRVFRNQVCYVPPERIHRRRNGFVIGWEESHGSPEDMAEVAEALSEWIINEREAVLYLIASHPVWQLFERLPEDKKRRFSPGRVETHYDFLRHIDVGIGPLRDTPSNRSRSDVEYLEYAAFGVVPVIKRLAPYTDTIIHGKTGFLYTNSSDLVENLALLSKDPMLLEGVAGAARNFVLQNRLEADQAVDRVEFYRELLLKTSGARDCRHLSHEVNGWAAMDGAVVTGRHIRLEPTKFELLLREGLAAMRINEKRETCFRLFRRASAIEPCNYLPYLYGASLSPNSVETLLKAVELNPSSLKARIMLGDALAQRGNPWEALRWFKTAAEVFSDYEIPYSKAASLLKQVGRSDQAAHLSEKSASLLGKGSFSAAPFEMIPAFSLHP